ncbi:MAG: TlpA family protein disulfide reductase [Cytophagaceae bacterium]|nr:MAG: TlpA family protein disulfide reductase [Cytophagaceae bacterium]
MCVHLAAPFYYNPLNKEHISTNIMAIHFQNLLKPRNVALAAALLATTAPVFAQGGAPLIPALPISPGGGGEAAPVAPVAPPVIDAAAKAQLDKTIERYRNLKTLSVTVDRSGRKQYVEFRAPQSLKVTSKDNTGAIRSQQFIGGPENITLQKVNDVYEWRTVAARPATPGREGRASLAGNPAAGPIFSSLLAGLDPFGEGSRYRGSSIALGTPRTVDGETLNAIVVTPPKAPNQPIEITLTLLIGQTDLLLHEVVTDTKLPNNTVNSSSEKFLQLKADADLPEANFVFTPPAGANKVENFSRDVLRATVGQSPLPINTKDLDGKEFSLDQFKGKVVLIDFWATWCGPCIGELPNVKANYEKYKDKGFDIVGISLDRTTDPLSKYIKDKDLPWRQIFDGYWDGPLATAFNVRGIPATILIGKDGKVAAVGARGDKLEPAIQAALAL